MLSVLLLPLQTKEAVEKYEKLNAGKKKQVVGKINAVTKASGIGARIKGNMRGQKLQLRIRLDSDSGLD